MEKEAKKLTKAQLEKEIENLRAEKEQLTRQVTELNKIVDLYKEKELLESSRSPLARKLRRDRMQLLSNLCISGKKE